MRKILLLLLLSYLISSQVIAQVTQLVPNQSLQFEAILSNNKVIMVGSMDRIWVSDGTVAGTFKLADTLAFTSGDGGGVLNGKFIFSATSPNLGNELWITDGTVAGTQLVKDIVPGKSSSEPQDDFAPLNGYLYFSAHSEGFGRELWRTNGTAAGTTMVKDIAPGAGGSALKGSYNIASSGTYLLFSVASSPYGYELWRSDGTEGGTSMLKDINPGMPSSTPGGYQVYNNTVLFWAETAANGRELWRTDGTDAGTQLVKDIRPGTASSITTGFPMEGISLLFPFSGKMLFVANDGTTGEEIWATDGTEAGTQLLQDINPGPLGSVQYAFAGVFGGVPMNGKLYFTAYKEGIGAELWETDGTQAGTKLFKEILPGVDGGIPFLMPNYKFDINASSWQPVHQGSVFYFLFGLPADAGVELWKSDGTDAGTLKIKTIRTDASDFGNGSYVYTQAGLYFSVDNGLDGDELWKSTGTEAGTTFLLDLNPGEEGSEISFLPFPVNSRYMFTGTDGDNMLSDLYVLDGVFAPLPVKMESFTVALAGADAQLKWQTASEQGTSEFVVERSDDGNRFTRIGAVAATGNSSDRKSYSFTDAGIANSGKTVVYYRLQIKDKDGKNAFSKVVSVGLKSSNEFTVQILGNPVQNEIRILFGKTTAPVNLSIRDAAGRTVKNLQVKNDNGVISIPATVIVSGAYFLQAECNGKVTVVKFMKQ